ncbi:germinal center-associated signaling and motility protein isoform X2 [Canis lupus familiaris]|uniref:germinal center-associated signaling and motility protein isoform X2 n=1 Tax=Canis lupus familiaris TaxID=9615 RepID=UPI0018F4FC09|nr:germinal center-associated signaling and motility protein isoform X2 [Canis lupus familiaris]
MGNSLLRENRWQQDTQEIPWTPKNQSRKQRTSRCCYCYFAEGCFCLPCRKICIFKAKPDSPKESKEMSSAPMQDSADQSSSEDLCYTLINHSVLGGKSSGISAERHSSSPEDAYELIIPRRVFSYSLQQPHPPTPHLENRVSY